MCALEGTCEKFHDPIFLSLQEKKGFYKENSRIPWGTKWNDNMSQQFYYLGNLLNRTEDQCANRCLCMGTNHTSVTVHA